MSIRRSFQTRERIEVLSKSGGRCWYCGTQITLLDFHVDHFIPLAKGGGNDIKNLVPSCSECNQKKGGKYPWEFRWALENKLGVSLLLFFSHQSYPWFTENSNCPRYKGWE